MKPRIALFLHQPKCSVQSGNGIMKALSDYYNFKIFTRHALEKDFFDDVDMVAIPGGIGDSDSYDYLMKVNAKRIKEFVNRGGKYLGICMGAYWADKDYMGLLDNIRAVQYIKRPGTDTKRPHAKNLKVNWDNQYRNMFFYDGCALVGDRAKFNTIATYMNNDPMAIIKDNIGLIGCHPESEPHWYDSYSWMRGKYHNGEHHALLLDFVDRLIKQ
jgi:glutamine amidotransferase-like uncharacterized protein